MTQAENLEPFSEEKLIILFQNAIINLYLWWCLDARDAEADKSIKKDVLYLEAKWVRLLQP